MYFLLFGDTKRDCHPRLFIENSGVGGEGMFCIYCGWALARSAIRTYQHYVQYMGGGGGCVLWMAKVFSCNISLFVQAIYFICIGLAILVVSTEHHKYKQ